MGKQK